MLSINGLTCFARHAAAKPFRRVQVLRKKPSERAGFDTMVLEQLEKGFQDGHAAT